jgi:hypothetical protein
VVRIEVAAIAFRLSFLRQMAYTGGRHSRTAFVLHCRRRCTGPPFLPGTAASAFRHWLWCSCEWVRLQPVCLVLVAFAARPLCCITAAVAPARPSSRAQFPVPVPSAIGSGARVLV